MKSIMFCFRVGQILSFSPLLNEVPVLKFGLCSFPSIKFDTLSHCNLGIFPKFYNINYEFTLFLTTPSTSLGLLEKKRKKKFFILHVLLVFYL